MLARLTATLLLPVACALGTAAAAQEYCVVCFDPPARYRCMVGFDPGTAPSPSRAQFVCIPCPLYSSYSARAPPRVPPAPRRTLNK